jgi:vacuolar-type H+-ATPase subunit H
MERPSRAVTRPGPIGPIGGFLERFRRSGGVPVAVGGEVTTELAVVLAALDGLEREAEELRARSEADSARRIQEAEQETERILVEARERAESERDDALTAGLRAADATVAGVVAQAEADAERIREAGAQRLPDLVAEVLARVLEAGA